MMSQPQFDLVIYGATSFVGQIVLEYMLQRYGVDGEISWAAAGRSWEKLQRVRDGLGAEAGELSLLVADAGDEGALRTMCEQARVIVSTVGPYDLYGSTLVKVCAETGTDYCDLTGEARWVRRMSELYHETAQASGARLVHSCGFDSLPSDMGVYFLQQHAQASFGEYCRRVAFRAKAADGAFSGGTVATMLNERKFLAEHPHLQDELEDPYYLCPPGYRNSTAQHRVSSAEYDEDFGCWIAPFIMAPINEPVVMRSQALAGNPYGEAFTYNEGMLTAPGLKGRMIAATVATAMKAFNGATGITGLRNLLARHVLPSPGEGPSKAAQEKGFYDIRLFGETPSGHTLQVKVTGDRDPGYGSTAKMLAEAGICLARDITQRQQGGSWSSAIVFDQGFIDRLCDNAGMTFELLEPTVP